MSYCDYIEIYIKFIVFELSLAITWYYELQLLSNLFINLKYTWRNVSFVGYVELIRVEVRLQAFEAT